MTLYYFLGVEIDNLVFFFGIEIGNLVFLGVILAHI